MCAAPPAGMLVGMDPRSHRLDDRPDRSTTATGGTRDGRRWAVAAFVVGLAYALVSMSWGLGRTWALATVGGELASAGRSGNAALGVVVWVSVVLKLTAATLGLAVTRAHHRPRALVVAAAWVAAGVLTVYGGVLTFVGWLVQTDVIHAGADADQRALAWHAFLWDPWFLIWGLLLAAALWRSRRRRIPDPTGVPAADDQG